MVNGFRFSKRSKEKLKEAEPLLRELMCRALMTSNSDFSVICGHRTEEEQNEARNADRTVIAAASDPVYVMVGAGTRGSTDTIADN